MKSEEELIKSLKEEHKELDTKIHNIEMFLYSNASDGLPDLDREFLEEQLRAMIDYRNVLEKRIALHTEYTKK